MRELIEMEKETNLMRLLRIKNISASTVGAVIGVKQPQTIRRKLYGQFPFKLGEAKKIHHELFPEYDFDYVFDEYCEVEDEKEDVAEGGINETS